MHIEPLSVLFGLGKNLLGFLQEGCRVINSAMNRNQTGKSGETKIKFKTISFGFGPKCGVKQAAILYDSGCQSITGESHIYVDAIYLGRPSQTCIDSKNKSINIQLGKFAPGNTIVGQKIFVDTNDKIFVYFSVSQTPYQEYTGQNVDVKKVIVASPVEFSIKTELDDAIELYRFDGVNLPCRTG